MGENESSVAYVRNLVKTGERVGIEIAVDRLPRLRSLEVRERLERLRDDRTVHGVMLQQPLPPHLSIREIADAIPVRKDVDGAPRPTKDTSPSEAAPNSRPRRPPP